MKWLVPHECATLLVIGVIISDRDLVVLAAVLIITGAAIGVLTVASVGIHREERAFTLTSDIPDRVVRGARWLNGVYTRSDRRGRLSKRSISRLSSVVSERTENLATRSE